jgi:hypothetical protein
MGPKTIFIAILAATLLAWSGSSIADEYRANEFLSLDLSQALLSPKRLGPESEFAPVAIEARTDRSGRSVQADVEPEPHAKPQTKVRAKIVVSKTRIAQARAEKPRGAARTKLAHRHGNPLDAQAQDTRVQHTLVQAWPCKSGGICNWK